VFDHRPLYLEFVYTEAFVASAERLLGETDFQALEERLIDNPRVGVVERGTGGVRKLRVASSGRGRSGGARVIYLFVASRGRAYLLFVYPKNQKASLTSAERNQLKWLTEQLEKE
jgi:hypothetical protein